MPPPGDSTPVDVEDLPCEGGATLPEADTAISPLTELKDAKVKDGPSKQVAEPLPFW